MVAVSTIQALREQLERFNRPRVEAGAVRPTGWPAVDAVLGGGLRAGSLHEWFGVSVEG
jgi:protein ImuA